MAEHEEPVEGSGEEIIDAPGAIEQEAQMVTTELVHRPQGTTQLIVADTAGERVAQATEIATALDSVIRAQGMRTKVGSQKRIDPGMSTSRAGRRSRRCSGSPSSRPGRGR
jgi:hypothetical protein